MTAGKTMSEVESEELQWIEVGNVEEMKERKCRRLYTASGKDLALFYVNGTFFLTSAICPHAGGPIDQADIEDLGNNSYMLTCPLHFITFDLKSGVSPTGMKLKTYETDVRSGKVFGNIPEQVTLKRVPKG